MQPAPGDDRPIDPTTWTAPLPAVPETRNDRAADTPAGSPPTTPYLAGPAALFQPYRFGDYQILERLGGGGMGTVYRALNTWLNREEALKVIAAGRLASIESRRRFQEEMQATARLRHPHIVEVFAAGAVEGEPFFTMSLETGGDLAGLARDNRRPTPTRAAAVVRQIAGAVEYAHRQGLVHRDLKPSNVLLAADGRPRVTDFGLAVLMADGPATAGVEGTPGYMSPEQADGGADAVGRACDVYGLGAILYELLTGQAPFRGETVAETLRKVRTEPPVPPRTINPRVPRKLEQICLKCLEKSPRARYASAGELAAELDAFLQPAWRRTVRPALTVLAMLVVTGLCAALAWTAWQQQTQELARVEELRRSASAHVAAARADAAAGRRSRALDSYALAQEDFRVLSNRRPPLPDLVSLRLAWADVRTQRGILLREQQQQAAAEEEFTAARGELEAMQDVGVERRLRLAEVYHNLGILHDARGTRAEQHEALRWYEQGLLLRQELVAFAAHDRIFRRDLARSHGYTGDTQLQLGLNDAAAASYASAAEIRESLVVELRGGDATPEELMEARCQRARDFGNLGTLHDWTGELDRAIEALEERRRYFTTEPFPLTLPGQFRTDRVDNLLTLAELRLQRTPGPWPEVPGLLREAASECERLLAGADEKDSYDVEACLAWVRLCEGAYEARRGTAAAAARPLQEAVATLKRLESAGVADASDLYRHALAQAVLAGSAGNAADRGFHEGLALDRLELAVQRGYKNRRHLDREPGFDGLRKTRREQFDRVIARIEPQR
jgi:hypothetical protein